ncbi:hypothetical protein HZS_1416 [Henneguya salminicola]|nr:hypothetical protein HZS_1416 [Henneguya salminicola]
MVQKFKGDLHSYISKNTNIFHLELLNFIEQSSKGFEYLHQQNIVHGDIAARNVLLTKELVLKVFT